MQRKNNILMSPKYKGRNAFAMIMAIIVLIVVGGLMSLSLSFVAQTGKRTTDLYLYEQAILVSKSAAELALLDIAQNAPCTIASQNYRMDLNGNGNTNDDIYDVNVTLKYVYVGAPCGDIDGDGINDDYFTTMTTDEQNGSVLMDITVTTNEGTEPIRYFRRSIQKL